MHTTPKSKYYMFAQKRFPKTQIASSSLQKISNCNAMKREVISETMHWNYIKKVFEMLYLTAGRHLGWHCTEERDAET